MKRTFAALAREAVDVEPRDGTPNPAMRPPAGSNLQKLIADIDPDSTTLLDLVPIGRQICIDDGHELEIRQIVAAVKKRLKGTPWTKGDVETALRTGHSAQKGEDAAKAKRKAEKAREARGDIKEAAGEWLPDAFIYEGDENGDGMIVAVAGPQAEYRNAVCRNFRPVSRAFDADGGNESLIVLVVLNGKPTAIRIPVAEMAGGSSATIRALSKAGLTIIAGEEQSFQHLLREAFMRKDLVRLETADTPGWKQADEKGPSVFVLPDGQNVCRGVAWENKAGELKTPKVLLTHPRKHQIAGSWKGYADSLHACWESGLTHFMMSPLTAMVGVLGSYVGLPTFIASDTGDSSQGKTTALRIKAAAVGDPRTKKGPLRSLKATANSTEIHLEAANHSALCLDEAALFEGNLEDLIFMVADGAGKDRAHADMTAREAKQWTTCVFLTSESSIDEMLMSAARKGGKKSRVGAVARCIDIPVVRQSLSKELIDRIEAAFPSSSGSGHYGHYLPRFVGRLFNDGDTPEDVERRIESKARELADSSDPLQLRVARFFATAWEVGEIVTRPGFGALPASVTARDIESFIKATWESFIGGETARNLDPNDAAAEGLRAYLLKNHRRHGQNVDSKATDPFGELKFYYRPIGPVGDIPAGAEFWILQNDVASLLAEASNTTATAKGVVAHLDATGTLIRQRQDELVTDYVPGHGHVRTYHLHYPDMDVSTANSGTDATDDAEAETARAEAEDRRKAANAEKVSHIHAEEQRKADAAAKRHAEPLKARAAPVGGSMPELGVVAPHLVVDNTNAETAPKPRRRRRFP